MGEDPEAAVAVIHQLPDLHKLVFHYLVRFLQLFARYVRPEQPEREREDDITVVVIEIVRAVNSDPHRSGRGNFCNKNRKRARKFVIIVIY